MATIPITYNTAMSLHKMSTKYEDNKSDFKNEQIPGCNMGDGPGFYLNTPPAKYSSKMMNSIWGLYNRYAAPSFKKNSESNDLAASNKPLSQVAWLSGHHPN